MAVKFLEMIILSQTKKEAVSVMHLENVTW